MSAENKNVVTPFEFLTVVQLASVGTFLSRTSEQDVLLPFSEQTDELQVGDQVVVAIFQDQKNRPTASMKLEKFIEKVALQSDYKSDQKVDLLITHKTDLGYKAIVNGRHWGVLYNDEVFGEIFYGQRLEGYIKKVREDGKIDLKFSAAGHQAAIDDIGPRLLELLEQNNGFMNLTDKTEPERIYNLFGVSKKKFKIALGALYKKRLIEIKDDGIQLVRRT